MFQAGDILACHGRDVVSRGIRLATTWPLDPWSVFSPPSHVAICCRWHNEVIAVESTSFPRRACLIQRKQVQGVQAHSPHEVIGDYRHACGRVDVYRLVGIHRLTNREDHDFSRWLIDEFVKPGIRYDTAGAILSAERISRLVHRMPNADLNQLFCSELIAAVLMRVGLMNQDNAALYSPGRLLRELLRLGKYKLIRRDVPAILQDDEEEEFADAA